MKELLIAIGAFLLTLLGLVKTRGDLKQKKAEVKDLEIRIEQMNDVAETQTEIMQVAVDKKEEPEIKRKGPGKLPHLIIVFCFFFITSCTTPPRYISVCPAIPILSHPEFADVEYDYRDGEYIFTDDQFESLVTQWKWALETIKKYEEMLTIYEKFRSDH